MLLCSWSRFGEDYVINFTFVFRNMPRSRSRSRSYSPRRRREPDRGDRGSYERRDERERDRKRREGERYDEDRRNRHSDRRPYSRERYKRPRRDEHEHEERFRNRQQNSHPPRHSRSPSRSHSPPTAAADKGKPNFKPSGLLAAETNTVKKTDGTSVVLKYNEPPEARRPTQSWRLYVFKGKEQLGKKVASNCKHTLFKRSSCNRNITYLSSKCLPCWKRSNCMACGLSCTLLTHEYQIIRFATSRSIILLALNSTQLSNIDIFQKRMSLEM